MLKPAYSLPLAVSSKTEIRSFKDLIASKLFSLRKVDKAQQLLGEVQRMLGGMLKKLSLPAASGKLKTSNSYA